MKHIIKLITVIVAGLFSAFVPFYALYSLWGWLISQVPLTSEWAGLTKVGITLVLLLIGGGTTIGLAFLFGAAAIGFVAWLLE